MKKTLIFLFFILNVNTTFCNNDIIGSDTTPSRQSFFEFSGFNNRVAGFAAMEHGFGLQDQSTSCTFDSTFPVDYFFNLNDGTLYLNTHLDCDEHL